MSATRSPARAAPATDMAGTLILATHGIAGGPGAAAAHAQAIRARSGWEQVRVGCLKAAPSLAEAMADAPAPVTVVPLLMTEGFIHAEMQRRLDEIAPEGGWRLTAPVGTSPSLAKLVRARARRRCAASAGRRDHVPLADRSRHPAPCRQRRPRPRHGAAPRPAASRRSATRCWRSRRSRCRRRRCRR